MPAVGPSTAMASMGPATAQDMVLFELCSSRTSWGSTTPSTLTLKFVVNSPNRAAISRILG